MPLLELSVFCDERAGDAAFVKVDIIGGAVRCVVEFFDSADTKILVLNKCSRRKALGLFVIDDIAGHLRCIVETLFGQFS